MLTGLYLLEGTRTAVSCGKSVDASTGLSSALVGAFSSVPIGASVSLGLGSSWEMAMQVAEPHVWAAQFRLLDSKVIKIGKGGVDDVKLPPSMGLYRDVTSTRRSGRKSKSSTSSARKPERGQMLALKLDKEPIKAGGAQDLYHDHHGGSQDAECKMIEEDDDDLPLDGRLLFGPEEDDDEPVVEESQAPEDDQDSTELEEYEKQLERAIEIFEMTLKVNPLYMQE